MIIYPHQFEQLECSWVEDGLYRMAWPAWIVIRLKTLSDKLSLPETIDFPTTKNFFNRSWDLYHIPVYTLCNCSLSDKNSSIIRTLEHWDVFVEEHFPHLIKDLDDNHMSVYLSEYSSLRQTFQLERKELYTQKVTPTMKELSKFIQDNKPLYNFRQFSIERCFNGSVFYKVFRGTHQHSERAEWNGNYLRAGSNKDDTRFENIDQIYSRLKELGILDTIVACQAIDSGALLPLPDPVTMTRLSSTFHEIRLFNRLTVLFPYFNLMTPLAEKEKAKGLLNLPILDSLYPIVASEHDREKSLLDAILNKV